MTSKSSILKWALPPGVSLAIHSALIILLLIVGSRAAGLAAQSPKPNRLPLAELEITALPQPTQAPEPDSPDSPQPSPNQQPAPQAPNTLDRSAKALSSTTPIASQAMSAATLDQLASESTSLSNEPAQAPAAISFAGVSTGAARSIVYVIDTSGATMTSLSYIRERLLQSIDRLSPTQRFQVIAFRKLGDSTYTTPKLITERGKLPRATRANKQAVSDWLKDMPAQGRSNPIDGLQAALELKPDMILLIARGIQRTEAPWAGGLKHVRQRLDELNPLDPITGQRPVVIKTIQLLDEDPTGIMRTIGVFHGDGHNDHQIITYNQLSKPEPPRVNTVTTTTDTRLSSAEDLLASLKASGALYRAATSIPTSDDRSSIESALSRINALLQAADPQDPRTALLQGESELLGSQQSTTTHTEQIIDILTESVFVSPELDARRRIVLAQLNARSDQTLAAIADLHLLIDERAQLKISELTVARAILTLASISTISSDLINQPPFTTDPAWAILLAESRSLYALSSQSQDPLGPLLNLRETLKSHTPQIDESIARLFVYARTSTPTDTTQLPPLARFIDARARITLGDEDQRLDAINTLLDLGQSPDRQLAQDSLWLACLGSRALNTRRSGIALMHGAAMLATRFPEHEGAPDALAGAIDTATQSRSPNLVPLLRQAVALYQDRIEIDLWRLQLINLTQGPEQTTLIKALTPATRESDLGAQIYHDHALSASPSDPLAHAAITAQTLENLRSPLAGHWQRKAAELELPSNPISAASRLARLVPPTPSTNDPDLEILYAQALIASGHADDALKRLASFTNALTELPNSNQDNHFWHAWTLIIETIATQGNDADKDSARAHLTRLQLIDPKLGPEPFRSRLTRARNTLHSKP